MPDVRRAPHVFGAGSSGVIPNHPSLLANRATRAPSPGQSFTHVGRLQTFSRRLPHQSLPSFSPVSRSRLRPVRFGTAIPGFSPSYFNRLALPEASLPSLLTAPAFGSGPPIPRRTRTLAPASTPQTSVRRTSTDSLFPRRLFLRSSRHRPSARGLPFHDEHERQRMLRRLNHRGCTGGAPLPPRAPLKPHPRSHTVRGSSTAAPNPACSGLAALGAASR